MSSSLLNLLEALVGPREKAFCRLLKTNRLWVWESLFLTPHHGNWDNKGSPSPSLSSYSYPHVLFCDYLPTPHTYLFFSVFSSILYVYSFRLHLTGVVPWRWLLHSSTTDLFYFLWWMRVENMARWVSGSPLYTFHAFWGKVRSLPGCVFSWARLVHPVCLGLVCSPSSHRAALSLDSRASPPSQPDGSNSPLVILASASPLFLLSLTWVHI